MTITLIFIVGMVIFGGMILLKVDVWADKVNAEVETCRTSLDREDYLYQKTVNHMIDKKNNEKKGN
ncbi:MAG: hypothetical protein KAR05_01580 [Candidatus Omnitrophica bacterium]|nr:hypothetical protein [Candidatus Omnitrophota bacterium]